MANKNFTSSVDTKAISGVINDLMSRYTNQRRPFERRWYDNNFFDDGFHFRYLSSKTGKIVDLSRGSSQVSPRRSIPKASRQIRGVASLLLQLELRPGIYPERVSSTSYLTTDNMGQPIVDQEAFQQALKSAKDEAKKLGFWVDDKWDTLDMDEQIVHMMILAAKHSISFMEIWPDSVTRKTESKIFDAFDIYLDGTMSSIYDSPTITKAVPTLISEIKNNEMFDEVQRMRISPDNRYASSEVKQAYMQSRFGTGQESESQATIILRESFIKEYLNEDNIKRIRKQDNSDIILKDIKMGDSVIRQVFDTSNGWLSDEYTELSEYPYIDFRFEPGLIYQVPLIERFIPANKSLDIAVSRVEGFANTMVTGVYQKRKGENFKIANIPGGQVIEYEGTPLQQMNIASVPNFMFNFINLLEEIIEEQGASTSTLNKLPSGVKSGVAIESVKASEFANLKIPSKMYHKTVKRIAQRLVEYASDYLIDPEEVVAEDNGGVEYFDVIGEAGIEAREKAGLSTDGFIVINKNTKVRVEVENGLGYTVEGKKNTMQQIANYMLQLAEVGMVSKGQVQVMLNRFLEVFQFGSTAEFMDALEDGQVKDISEEDIDKIKIAMLEVMKDIGAVGAEADQRSIDATKVGMMEAVKDLGGVNATTQG